MKWHKSKDWLYQKYTKEKLSTIEIATMCKASKSTIQHWMAKFNIPRRTLREIQKLKYKNIKTFYRDKNWLYQKYWIEKLPLSKIASTCEASNNTILYYMKKFNISRRTRSESYKIWIKAHPEALRGENNPGWKGGKIITSGYIYLQRPNHPNATKDGYIFEHRIVMEQKIGRYLYPWEIVHHINGIKDDNRIENLKLLPGIEHNKKVQEVYQENLFLKQQLTNFLNIKIGEAVI